MSNPQNLVPFKPGYDERRGSKPKGAIHLSTRIQNMLNDPTFLPENLQGFTDNPMDAIIATAIKKASDGDSRWAKWLSDSGYGQKMEVEHKGDVTIKHLTDKELLDIVNDYNKN